MDSRRHQWKSSETPKRQAVEKGGICYFELGYVEDRMQAVEEYWSVSC